MTPADCPRALRRIVAGMKETQKEIVLLTKHMNLRRRAPSARIYKDPWARS